MTKEQFVTKWNVGYEDLEQKLEVAAEMMADLNSLESEISTETVKAIPFQCCPICLGAGRVTADGFTSNVYQVCRVCKGAKIIPMHLIN